MIKPLCHSPKEKRKVNTFERVSVHVCILCINESMHVCMCGGTYVCRGRFIHMHMTVHVSHEVVIGYLLELPFNFLMDLGSFAEPRTCQFYLS